MWFPHRMRIGLQQLTGLVGDRFTVRQDQERLRELWYACERAHGFPPTTTIVQLEESWGWHNR